jgi:hypothetical protein
MTDLRNQPIGKWIGVLGNEENLQVRCGDARTSASPLGFHLFFQWRQRLKRALYVIWPLALK